MKTDTKGQRGIGSGLGRARSLGLLRFPLGGDEEALELEGKPDQHAGFDDEDHGMQHDAAEIGSAREDRRRQDEVEREVMQRHRDRAGR